MITVIIINIIATFFAYLARTKNSEIFLKLSFSVIFVFLALRYNYGNDYSNYLEGFIKINAAEVNAIDNEEHFEPGWILLCRIFEPLGFFVMVACLAAINCIVYYRFVYKYVLPQYYWFAVFLYTFTSQMMLVNSTAMRQSLAGTVFIIAIDYLCNKNALKYFLCIILAASFHTSALVLLPVYLVIRFIPKIDTTTAICIFIIFICLFTFTKITGEYVNLLIQVAFDKYDFYDEAAQANTGLSFIYYSLILALILHHAKTWDEKKTALSLIAICFFLILPFGLIIALITRIGMYFIPATLAVYPFIFTSLKSKLLRSALIATIVLVTLYWFNTFFQSDTYKYAFGTYQTVFSAQSWE